MSTRTLLTLAQFDALPRVEPKKYELSEGELVMTASPRPLHGIVREKLGKSLIIFADAHHLGSVFWEMEFHLSAETVRIPDLSFVTAERMRLQNIDERIQGAPELAIEVVSPSNEPSDLILKAKQYLQTGARLVWIVYPQTQMVYIYRPGERVEIREDGQVLDAPELLPGWSIQLGELFSVSRS